MDSRLAARGASLKNLIALALPRRTPETDHLPALLMLMKQMPSGVQLAKS